MSLKTLQIVAALALLAAPAFAQAPPKLPPMPAHPPTIEKPDLSKVNLPASHASVAQPAMSAAAQAAMTNAAMAGMRSEGQALATSTIELAAKNDWWAKCVTEPKCVSWVNQK